MEEKKMVKVGVAQGVTLWHNNERLGPGQECDMEHQEALQRQKTGHVYLVAPEGVAGEERLTLLANLIKGLDPEETKLWTSEGKPTTTALEAVSKRPVSANDRDQAWEHYQTMIQGEG